MRSSFTCSLIVLLQLAFAQGDASCAEKPEHGLDQSLIARKVTTMKSMVAVGNDLLPGLGYIIRSKYPGEWKDAELSWDGRGDDHPRASVEFTDPVAWSLVPMGTNLYRVKSQYPGKYYNAELSWDSRGDDHPRASVEFNDPVNWEFIHQGNNQYVIRSTYPGRWHNGELSWDSRRDDHPRASVEFHDRVLWEVTPAITVKGYWRFYQTVDGNAGGSTQVQCTWGTDHTASWSQASSFSHTVTTTVEAGFEVEGIGAKASVAQEIAVTLSHSIGEAVTQKEGTAITRTFTASEKVGAVWQFIMNTVNNHHRYKGQSVVTKTKYFAATPRGDLPPKCLPSFCKFDTGCQECSTACGALDSDC